MGESDDDLVQNLSPLLDGEVRGVPGEGSDPLQTLRDNQREVGAERKGVGLGKSVPPALSTGLLIDVVVFPEEFLSLRLAHVVPLVNPATCFISGPPIRIVP